MTTWLQHVKKVHASGNTSFKDSLKRASASWKKAKGKAAAAPAAAAAPKKKRRGRKKKAAEEPEEPEEKAEPEKKKAEPKKKRRRRKLGPKLSGAVFKSIDSRNIGSVL